MPKSKSLFILPHKIESKGASRLAKKLNVLRIKLEPEETKYKPTKSKTVINWGFHGEHPALGNKNGKVLNNRTAVRRASNKVQAFQAFEKAGIPTPEFTTDYDTALDWAQDGHTVVARYEVSGSSASGLEIIEPSEFLEYDDAPLYSKYKKKKEEFRVHVINGEVVDFQKKALSSDVRREDANFQVRTHKNGFIFMRENIKLPDGAEDISIAAVKALGLDFGAVDLIWNGKENQCYVLEVNTAPGIEGSTVESYAAAFSGMSGGRGTQAA